MAPRFHTIVLAARSLMKEHDRVAVPPYTAVPDEGDSITAANIFNIQYTLIILVFLNNIYYPLNIFNGDRYISKIYNT